MIIKIFKSNFWCNEPLTFHQSFILGKHVMTVEVNIQLLIEPCSVDLIKKQQKKTPLCSMLCFVHTVANSSVSKVTFCSPKSR